MLILILLTLGLYPVLDHGELHMGVTRTMADSWGDEGRENGGWGGGEEHYTQTFRPHHL